MGWSIQLRTNACGESEWYETCLMSIDTNHLKVISFVGVNVHARKIFIRTWLCLQGAHEDRL